MKTLIRHLVENNFDEILAKSYLNCHVEGLHSLMLLESPGKTIRLYVADVNHRLENNNEIDAKKHPMTLSLHAHHCNLTLHCVEGSLLNWEAKESDKGIKLKKYLHHSAIIEGQIEFEKISDESYMETTQNRFLRVGDSVALQAKDIHSVACASGKIASWLVYSGLEDKNYIPYCWTNTDLEKEDFSHLYQKPTKEDIFRVLSLINL